MVSLVWAESAGSRPQAGLTPPVWEQKWVQISNADWGYYERLYGSPIMMSIDTLLDEPSVPSRQAIRTFGRFFVRLENPSSAPGGPTGGNPTGVPPPGGRPPTSGSPTDGSGSDPRSSTRQQQSPRSSNKYELCGEAKGHRCLTFLPVPEIGSDLEFQAESFRGQRVVLVGAFDQAGFLVWSFEVAPESVKRGQGGPDTGLRAVVAAAGAGEGRSIRVRGQFRGRNLFGDLPSESQRGRSDWVLADQGTAVWVTGKAPKGSGWSLDLDSRSESVRWLEVEGEPVARDGVIYLKAKSVTLVSGPIAPAVAER